MQKIRDPLIKQRWNEMKTTWAHLFFGSPEKFVTIIDYKNPAGQIDPKLHGKNIHRISREYTNNIIKGLKEMQFVSNHLNKSYKQEILDSNEFYGFLEDLFEIGTWSNYTKVDTYPIASKLFNMSLEILNRNAPEVLKEELKESVKRFIKFNNLAIRLGYKKSGPLELPRFLQ